MLNRVVATMHHALSRQPDETSRARKHQYLLSILMSTDRNLHFAIVQGHDEDLPVLLDVLAEQWAHCLREDCTGPGEDRQPPVNTAGSSPALFGRPTAWEPGFALPKRSQRRDNPMPDPYKDAGRVLLRSGVGGVLIAHGCQKLFGWFGGGGPEGTAEAFESMGFHPGLPSAIAAGVGEAGGGACLVLGLGTPIAASAASGTMLAAAAVHAPAGFFAQSGGYEYAALLGVSTAALALTGPGEWSLDRALGYPLNKPWLSIAALVASTAGAAVVLQRRKRALAAPQTASEVAA